MLHKTLDGEYRWMCVNVWFAFGLRLVASVGNSGASGWLAWLFLTEKSL